KDSATAFLERALAWFARHGVAVERIMTANGSCYRSQLFRQACAKHGIRHLWTRPYRPRTNGKAERLHARGQPHVGRALSRLRRPFPPCPRGAIKVKISPVRFAFHPAKPVTWRMRR